MRGFNIVVFSGNVSNSIKYGNLPDGSQALSFAVASDREAGDVVITAWAKINVYSERLISSCRSRLKGGGYVLVKGELMNREGRYGQLLEVRAHEIIFIRNGRKEGADPSEREVES